MLDIDLENIGEKLPLLLLLSGLFLLLYFTAYRKRIFSIFDPLSIMAVTQAASSVMAIALISQASMLWQFMLSQAAFTLGVVLAPVQSLPKGPTSSWSKGDIYFAEWVVMVLFSILVAANVWLGLSAGFPLFSDDPSLTKFSTFTGGLGLVRRINWGIGTFVPTASLLLGIRGCHRRLFWGVFVASMIISSLGGSKGALLVYLEIIVFVLFRKDIVSDAVARRLNGALKGLALIAGLLALFVLYISIHDPALAAGALLKRVLYAGDVIIYYYQPAIMREFAKLGPVDYIIAMLNPLLGELRLAEYQFPLGYQMLLIYFKNGEQPSAVLGPNTTFFVVGHIYFGWFFGIIYSGCVGYIVSKVRSACLSARGTTPLRMAIYLTMAIVIFGFPAEAPLFVSMASDTFIPLCMVVVLVAVAGSILRLASRRGTLAGSAA